MKLIEDVVMPYNTGRLFIVKKGQCIRVNAESIIDCVPFNLDNLRERFDQGRTKVHNGKIFLSTGDKLYTKSANLMMTIVEDTYKGNHDLQAGMCSRLALDRFYDSIKSGDPLVTKQFGGMGVKKRDDLADHGCWENIHGALTWAGYDVAPEDIPSPFNLFMSFDIVGSSGELVWALDRDRPEPGKPAHIDLRAEVNCLVALSTCPEPGMKGKPARIQVFDE